MRLRRDGAQGHSIGSGARSATVRALGPWVDNGACIHLDASDRLHGMTMEDRVDLARAICARAHLTGRFELRSGAVATEYFDKYLFESEPALLHAIAAALVSLVPPNTDALAGLERGGLPIATVLSQLTRVPAFFVRKEAKV